MAGQNENTGNKDNTNDYKDQEQIQPNNESNQNIVEEYDLLDSQLDEINTALDFLEQKNDDIHAKLKELLQSNIEIREQMKSENSSGSQ